MFDVEACAGSNSEVAAAVGRNAKRAYHGVPRLGRPMLYRQEALQKSMCDIEDYRRFGR